MNTPIITAGSSTPAPKLQRRNLVEKWRKMFQRRPPSHDPMLVFNMSIFNLNNGWNRIFNPLELRRHD